MQTSSFHRGMLPLGTALVLAFSSGCSLFERRSEFAAITQPISYRSVPSPNQDQNIATETPSTKQDSDPPSKWHAIKNKTNQAMRRTNQVVLHSLAWITGIVVKSVWDDLIGEDKKAKAFDPDPLWHQGYGFNNPNVERIRNGQPVLNFDGTVARDSH